MRSSGVALISLIAAGAAAAAPQVRGQCHIADVQFQPMLRPDLSPGVNPPPQIVAWVEDRSGTYVDTIFITKDVGTYGLGNRPGRFDFNSGPLWPYGRRVTTFPVWAHKHGMEFPEVVFQNGQDSNLSHPVDDSSHESHYCRPMTRGEPSWDALTCASPTVSSTDKGMLSVDPNARSLYPPRQDILRVPGDDSTDIDRYTALNVLDAVSQATPVPGQPATLSWPIPDSLAAGDYVMWVEVAKEFDHNTTYSEAAYPAPSVPWAVYGVPYRGQPSILFKVPFSVVADTPTTASTIAYVGYGDPDGLDGNVRGPDATITANVPGSGASRFALVADATGVYRVRVTTRFEEDSIDPSAPADMGIVETTSRTATFSFIASGDDGRIGKVKGYEIRYRAIEDVTDTNFDDPRSQDPKLGLELVDPGMIQTFTLNGLLPETDYSVGLRAFDDCHNTSLVTVLRFTTPQRAVGEVDACFVATAAYGSILAADVQVLRHMRDAVLRKSALGELAVEAYYTFGPALAGMISESELLRATTREMLVPVVRYARAFTP